jgi:hypothetical protein
VSGDRTPQIGDVVAANGHDGKFWIAKLCPGQTVQLRPIENEQVTTPHIAWKNLNYLESPGTCDHQTHSTAHLLELAAECYAKYMVQARSTVAGVVSRVDAAKAGAMLADYDSMVAILKARGAVPSPRATAPSACAAR